jgi:hypothetical protein
MGSEVFYGRARRWIVTRLESPSFEVERFELARDACLEVRGRWFGVRGRRFIRPTLTAVAGGTEQRLLAVLDHKPWIAQEGETWLAAFPGSTESAALLQADQVELTVAPDVTVPLPPPSSAAGGRRPRAGSRRSRVREADTAVGAGEPSRRPKDDRRAPDGSLQVKYRAALRSRDETLSELDTVARDRERLRRELGDALAARETAIAERKDLIEAEVRLGSTDLRAEAERERTAAARATQIARERDTARAERAEALRERDEANAERDAARRERNRMLAQRDTARTRAADAMRQWEATAALATRRTHERDAAASERDRAAHERHAALQEREQALREQTAAMAGRAAAQAELQAPSAATEQAAGIGGGQQPTATYKPAPAETGPAARVPGSSSRPSAPISGQADRTRHPPAPAETPVRDNDGGRNGSGSVVHPVRLWEATGMWRARLLAIAGLLAAFVCLVVILAAK